MSLVTIYPTSVFPADTGGHVFSSFYAGGGGNTMAHDEGLQIAASITADYLFELRYPLPPTLPTGTAKLLFKVLANASAGVAPFIVADAVIAVGGNPSAAPPFTESTLTLSWASVTAFCALTVSSIGAAGSGYGVGDLITLAGGTSTTATILRVKTLSGSGVATVDIIQQGVYSVKPANAVAQGSTSGVGTGATFNLTWTAGNGPDGYIEGKVTLTPAMIANSILAVALTCHGAASAWTLAANCTVLGPALIWE